MRAEDYCIVEGSALIDVAKFELGIDPGCDLPPGAHIITSRRRFLHHGIYVGDGNVIHYSGWARGLHRGPVEETSLDRFACGGGIWVRRPATHHFAPTEVIRRARSRVGEDRYRVFSNNCEHFCEWCVHGEHRSFQVQALLQLPARLLEAALRLITGLAASFVAHAGE